MKKRKRLPQNKDKVHNLGSDDILGRLPDEILVSILSKLPLKEAAATSLLSRRWRYLWCQTHHLVFEYRRSSGVYFFSFDDERSKYVSWVNHVIHHHKSPNIDEFKIRFGLDLDKNAKRAISKWVKFAISKNVQTLELNLERVGYTTCRNYRFPDKIFDRKCGYSLERPVMEIKFLRSLILKFVKVNDEGLKKILSNCPFLEHLSIICAGKLTKVEVCGKGLALKNLEIIDCDRLESIEIRDSNIASFTCRCLPTKFCFDNLQKLEKMCISVGYSWKKLNDMFHQISCHVPYLQVLEFYLYRLQGSIELLPFPMLQKLKQLTFEVSERGSSYFVLPFLVEACPDLQRLKVKMCSQRAVARNTEVLMQFTKKPLQRLEVIEIFEYSDRAGDLELVMYFVRNCVALKTLVIKPFIKLGRTVNEIREEKSASRNRARWQLEPIIPAGVKFVML